MHILTISNLLIFLFFFNERSSMSKENLLLNTNENLIQTIFP